MPPPACVAAIASVLKAHLGKDLGEEALRFYLGPYEREHALRVRCDSVCAPRAIDNGPTKTIFHLDRACGSPRCDCVPVGLKVVFDLRTQHYRVDVKRVDVGAFPNPGELYFDLRRRQVTVRYERAYALFKNYRPTYDWFELAGVLEAMRVRQMAPPSPMFTREGQ